MNYKTIDKNSKSKNINILKQIQKFLDKNQIDRAGQYMKEYIEQSSNSNKFILLKYAQILRLQTNYEEALPILEKLLLTDNKNYALSELVLIYIQKKEYENAYECIKQLKKIELDKEQLKSLKFFEVYLRCQIDGTVPEEIDGHPLNIIYNEEHAIGHIIKHHCFYTHDNGKGYFKREIDIHKLFYDVKKMIKENDLKFYCRSNSNCYYFYYKNIGYDIDNQSTSVFVAVVNPILGIITMYPVYDTTDKSMLNIFEIKEEILEEKQPKIKSQIDKFYQKYGKMN